MFSHRTAWDAPENRLTRAIAARRAHGAEILDLTESNPTRAGIEYPFDTMERLLVGAARAPYIPDPCGIERARNALAASLSSADDRVPPVDLVITASTSEAYGFLFKLLCDPGDAVLTAVPSYPLFEHLAALESVELHHFPLELHRRWEINIHDVERAITARTRAIVLVHPNNPTGSYVSDGEWRAIAELAADRGLAVISDEVFFDYPLDGSVDRAPSIARSKSVLTFSLGGLSKSAGLPHWKLGWIRVGGPEEAKCSALQGLELIADSYLSVATPVQVALPAILESVAPAVRGAILERTRANLRVLEAAVAGTPSVCVVAPEGGWSAVLRIPRIASDETVVLDLLDRDGVLVHPGYFFDFPSEGFLVLSLLTPPDVFAEGVRRVVAAPAR
ncbi:MAG: pyridoxal phosphate-dependent aminotransferase [Thermoanaerobaculia bacterium]